MKGKLCFVLAVAALLLSGCRQGLPSETISPQTPAPTAALDGWQEAYSQILQPENRKDREKAREEAHGNRSVEKYYALCDVDGDEIPELLIIYWELGRYYTDVYAWRDEKPPLAGTFYCGRLDSRFYTHPEEAGLWNEAVRADPIGETHWWRKFTLTDGVLEAQELLDETIEWEGEGVFTAPARPAVTMEELIPGAQPVELIPLPTEQEPMTPEAAVILYARFLQDDVLTFFDTWRESCYHSEFYSGLDMERVMDIYHTQELTGDDIPELFLPGPGMTYIWSIEDGEIVCIDGKTTYETLLPNGGIFYHRPGGAPEHHDYHYQWLSPESHELPEMGAQTYDMDNDGVLETFSFWVDGDRIDVTEEAWNEAMAPYFALLEEEPPPRPTFREWVAELGVELPTPEMDEAKAWRIFIPYVAYDWSWHNQDKDQNILCVWDFDGNGIPEVYENVEPYLTYGIVGLHVEELGSADDLGERPGVPLSFSEWSKQCSEKCRPEKKTGP